MADVGGEAGLPLDPGLHGVGHRVERVDDAGEVGVPLGGDSGVEVAGGDLAGGRTDSVERAQQPAARPHADGGGEQRDDGRADRQREQQHPQRLFGVVERERLEVLGADLVERDPDAEVQVALEREALHPGGAVLDRRLQLGREGVGSGEARRRPDCRPPSRT